MRLSLPPRGWPSGFGLLLLLSGTLRAQTLPAPAAAPATDTIVRLDGAEVPGRVLLITPTELRYLPAPTTAGAPAGTPDTLRLPVAAVFLVRYANGTREVLTRPAADASPMLGDGRLDTLSATGREQLGRADARQYYRGRYVFWSAAGVTLYPAGPLFGLGSTALIARRPVNELRLAAPVPALLQDPDYGRGYRQQAHAIKRHKAWAGYGVAAGTYAALLLGVWIAFVTDVGRR